MGELALPIRSPPERVPTGRLWSDERLARAVGKGDARAFALIYQRHHQALYRYCRSILRDEHDAQDALQSTMTRAFAALGMRERDLALRPWLFRIAHNEAVTVLRKRRPTVALTETLEPADLGAQDTLERRERLATLLADLEELSERSRAALVMRELSGLSIEEIAAALGASPGATKQVLFEARAALHDFAEGRAMECEQAQRAISDEDRRTLRGRKLRAHLRACSGCRDFQAALATRGTDLHALAPGLAPLAATAILGRLLTGGAAGGHTVGLAAGSGVFAGGSGGVAAGSGGAAGASVVGGSAVGSSVGVSLAAKVAICIAVAATAAGGTRLALVHTQSGHAHRAVGSGAPHARAATTAVGGSRSGTAAHRSQAESARTGDTPQRASKGTKATPGASSAAHSKRLAAGSTGMLSAAESARGHHALGQGLGGSEAQRGHGEAGAHTVGGHSQRASNRRNATPGHSGPRGQGSGSARAKRTDMGTPSGAPTHPAGAGERGHARGKANPPAPQHPAVSGNAPGTTGAPTRTQSGQPDNGGPDAEARGGAKATSTRP